jgi:guanylate cyclase, other
MSAGAGFQLNYFLNDSKYDTTESIRSMTSQYFNGALAFIGPEVKCTTEARVAAAWNIPMIAFVSITILCYIDQ